MQIYTFLRFFASGVNRVMLKHPKHIIVCEKSQERREFIKQHYPDVIVPTSEGCAAAQSDIDSPICFGEQP